MIIFINHSLFQKGWDFKDDMYRMYSVFSCIYGFMKLKTYLFICQIIIAYI